eukprot:TRINITY_DN3282_c0_g1_i2.p1 TRINITY_DN3282_c0_g1~~TRINITY_DN3282_c0_g1_i2.p1  ORF type:complete len:163 (+),score=13.31 TRINITY_DN3282_c0_g1_i2:48-536(+)
MRHPALLVVMLCFFAVAVNAKARRLPFNVHRWSEADVCTFLKQENLGEYCEAFARAHIDGSKLVTLTDTDLVMVGMRERFDTRKYVRTRIRELVRSNLEMREEADDDEFFLVTVIMTPFRLIGSVFNSCVSFIELLARWFLPVLVACGILYMIYYTILNLKA